MRFGIIVILGFLGVPLASLFLALYLVLPMVAAVLVAQRGPDAYLGGPGMRIVWVLRYWTAFLAYP